MTVTPFGPAREHANDDRTVRPGLASGDRVRAAAGHVRGALAVLLVVAAPLVPGVETDELVVFGSLVAFAWIPASGLLTFAARRHPGHVVDAAALVLDLVLLALVQVVLAPATIVLLAGVLLLVASSTYIGGRWVGTLAGVGGVALVAVLAAASDRVDAEVDAFTVVVYPVFLVVLAWLLDSVATDRWHASTGLVQLGEKSEAILTGIGEAVVVTDPAGRVQQWNRAAATTFDCAAELARGRGCRDVVALVHEVRDLDCSGGCALLELGTVDVEVWRRTPTGARQPLLASASPVLDAAGELVEVVHSYRDITRLKEADEAKTLFLATASHELKTPLTVIRGFAQMLLLPEAVLGDDERAAALRAIDARSSQLSAIVDRLLMSSRIDAGRIELVATPTALAPILQERADALEGSSGREVALLIAEDLPEGWCDADAFTTVVDHLLDNAVKYSPGGGPITVAASAVDDGIEVLVADEGIGMNPQQIERCFERFWQAEATDVRRFGGTGIGLYIVRSLVEGMGGTISVTSVPGTGAMFRVLVPRADRLPVEGPDTSDPPDRVDRGERSMIREYMRQLGIDVEREAVR